MEFDLECFDTLLGEGFGFGFGGDATLLKKALFGVADIGCGPLRTCAILNKRSFSSYS
jgi:hypothetical protein